jgi:phosphoadenosine phosphosulfate reductase
VKLREVTGEFVKGELSSMDAEELIRWAFTNFSERAAIGTSFQLAGSVTVDLASRHFNSFRVFTVDPLRLHPETIDVVAVLEKRYGIKVERFFPDEELLKNMVDRFGEYLFFMDKAKQEYCCYVRKPNRRALKTLDVWITGLRRDQSGFRKDVEKAAFVEEEGRRILKLAPLADWDTATVWRYIRENGIPYNPLFDKGYDSVGCVICSTPLVKGEPPRAGRWRWFSDTDDKKECGIHTSKEVVNDRLN